ncbi:diguanylate cyclase domain-containing protein [Paraeggerthella sp.]
MSVGTAFFPQDGKTYQELFDAADSAMYEEKRDKDSL